MILTQRHFYTPSTPPLGRLRWGKHPCHVGLPLSLSRREVQLTCRDQGGGTICCGWFPLQRLQRRLLSLRWCTVRPGLLTTCWGTGSARACSLGANILETEDRRLACSPLYQWFQNFRSEFKWEGPFRFGFFRPEYSRSKSGGGPLISVESFRPNFAVPFLTNRI